MINNWQNKTLLFVHVPKAAGTTLREIAARNYSPEQTFTIGNNIPAERIRLRTLERDTKSEIRLIFGHQCHGWHVELLPRQDFAYMTILREPTERVVSLRAYCDLHGHYLQGAVRGMTLEEFVTSGVTCTPDNGMTRQLCGLDAFGRKPYNDMRIPHGGVTREHFDLAVENIRQYAIVGTVPQFDDILDQCRQLFGWRISAYKRANVTRWKKPPITVQGREAIENFNQWDYQLYAVARDLFEERKGAEK